MKLTGEQVKTAIMNEAVNIKKKREIIQKARVLNEEAKKLNEMQEFMMGPGFKNSTSPGMPGAGGVAAQVLGLAGHQSSEAGDSDELNTVGNLNDLYTLDKEVGNEEEACCNNSPEQKIAELENELAELKSSLNEMINLKKKLA